MGIVVVPSTRCFRFSQQISAGMDTSCRRPIMKLSMLRGVVACFVVTSLLGLCRAADDAAADPLKDKNLTKNGSIYVLPAEQELADAMKDMRKLKGKIDTAAKKRAPIEAKVKQIKN